MRSKNNIITVLDIGTTKIACLVAEARKNSDIRILGHAVRSSDGFKSGVVIDLKQAEDSVLKTIRDAEKSSGAYIDKVVVSICNNDIYSTILQSTTIRHTNSTINERDIVKVTTDVLEKFKHDNHDIIHYFPLEYQIDGQQFIKDPLSMYGKELTTNMHIISAPTVAILNIANCLARCQIEVEDFLVSSYASAIASLNEDDINSSALLIDIGGTISNFVIYDNGYFVYTDCIPVGGWHVTSDIAQCFSLNFAHAERVKILHGNIISTALDEHKILELSDFREKDFYHGERNSIKVNDLSKVIKPRVEEIFDLIVAKLKKRKIWQPHPKRIIITGGASQLQGLKDLASYIMGGHVRIASPKMISGTSESFTSPAFATAIGMIKIVNDNRIKSDVLAYKNSKKNIFAKILGWF